MSMIAMAHKAVSDRPLLSTIGAFAGSTMAIITALNYFHVDVIPFAWAEDVDKIQESIGDLKTIVVTMNISQLQSDRKDMRAQLEEAQVDLAASPGSRLAKKEVERLTDEIAEVDRQVAVLRAAGLKAANAK